MGKNNKQRRANRKRDDTAERTQAERIVPWLVYHRVENVEPLERALEALGNLRPSVVSAVLEEEFASMLSRVWKIGWLPSEVLRQVRRTNSATHEKILACAISAYHQEIDPTTLHRDWRDHVAALGLGRVHSVGWFSDLADAEQVTWDEMLVLALDTLIAAETRIPLETIIPAPGTQAAKESIILGRVATSDPILEKVRNLLAQAESTKFDAEAEAFTAKAQELMARHSLDEALVWSRSEARTKPVVIRIAIDEPYIKAKSLFVQIVAEKSRCRAVYFPHLAMSSIVGFEPDVHATETLFTSLLVQAQSSLTRAASTAPPGARTRSRSYRASFLVAYARRIGERLAEINMHVESATSESADVDLLPVLAARSAAVDEAVDEWFADMTEGAIGGTYDPYGHLDGARAADLAELAKPVSPRT
jgi:Protein of unknown function (DUF2786)